MLNIPSAVKDLLKQSSVYKNFRVHFPNGERGDITNNNIVLESVTLQESICSQQTLMFNTCETPMIEFETIGVENIKGKTIECTLEVECPSTVTDAVQKADLGNKWIYPIPYGKYVITSCKKQSDMTHRQVQAYNYSTYLGGMSSIEKCKRDILTNMPTGPDTSETLSYDIIPYQYLIANNFVAPDEYSNYTYASDVGSNFPTPYVIGTFGDYRIKCSSRYLRANLTPIDYPYEPAYRREYFRLGQIKDLRTEFNTAKNTAKNKINEWAQTYSFTVDVDNIVFGKFCPEISMVVYTSDGGTHSTYFDLDYCYQTYPSNDYFTYISSYFHTISETDKSQARYATMGISMPVEIKFILEQKGTLTWQQIDSVQYTILSDYSDAIKIIDVDDYMLMTDNYPIAVNGTSLSEINPSSFIGFFYELEGKVCRMNRQGIAKPLSIEYQLANPVETLTPSDFSSFWYDDDMTKPYGRITCSYKNASGEDAYAEKYIVDEEEFNTKDYKTYDISDNNLIKNNQFSAVTIGDILDTMASNMDEISYMPMDLTIKGRPDLEVGDVVTVTTKEGDEIPALIMQRTLTGIMGLSDSMTASEEEEDISSLQLNSVYDSYSGTLSISLVGGK